MTISISSFYDPEDLYYEEDEWPEDDYINPSSIKDKEVNIYYNSYYDF